MREVNGIVYGDSVENSILVTAVKPLANRMMLLDFNNGERRLFDSTLLCGSAFARLDIPDVFFSPTIDHGTITWDDGSIDVASEYVYANSFVYNERDILTA